jgi:hypothetical protein
MVVRPLMEGSSLASLAADRRPSTLKSPRRNQRPINCANTSRFRSAFRSNAVSTESVAGEIEESCDVLISCMMLEKLTLKPPRIMVTSENINLVSC